MEYVFWVAAVFASVHTITYGLWEKKQGNNTGAMGVFFVAVICIGLTVYTLITRQ